MLRENECIYYLIPSLQHITFGLLDNSLDMATNLVHLPEIERLSSRVIRILGGNPGKVDTFQLQKFDAFLI